MNKIVLRIPVGLLSKISINLFTLKCFFFIFWEWSSESENNAVSDPEKKADIANVINKNVIVNDSSNNIFNSYNS